MTTINPYDGIKLAEEDPEHLQAIGQFVTTYSAMESFFIDVFIRYSGIEVDMARAILAGSRIKDIIERTKRVMRLKQINPDALKDFEQIETLFDPLSTFRDKVVHRVWLTHVEKGSVVLNVAGAKSLSGIVQEPISTEDLNTKLGEVLSLSLRLLSHYLTLAQWRALPEHFREMLHEPWPDKRPSPNQNT